ncbi:MAG: peptidylprolyl isomerase, partial [Spirosomataceae bacterium]
MEIAENTVVSLTYELYIDAEEDNQDEMEIVEVVGEDDPMVFIHGMSGLPPVFEEKLRGLTAGDSFHFTIESQDGYGDVDVEAIVNLPKEIFMVDGQIAEDILQIGNFVPFNNEENEPITGRIADIGEEYVIVDFNHPLAGKEMHFDGKIVGVRAATPEELDHGHVHGPGGVNH